MVSDDFKEAVITSRSMIIDCEFCGRTYFADPDDWDYDEGVFEKLLEKEKADPDKYIHVTGGEHWGNFHGKQAVVDCVCNSLEPYEKFIWSHRYIIAKYLKKRLSDRISLDNYVLEELPDAYRLLEVD